LVFYLL